MKNWVYRINWFKKNGGKNFIPDGRIYRKYEEARFQAEAQKQDFSYTIETIELV